MKFRTIMMLGEVRALARVGAACPPATLGEVHA